MPQEELDLFDFTACSMAQFRTSPTQIVWSDVIQLCSFGTPPNDVPDDVFGNAFTPRRSVSADGPEVRRPAGPIQNIPNPRVVSVDVALSRAVLNDLKDRQDHRGSRAPSKPLTRSRLAP